MDKDAQNPSENNVVIPTDPIPPKSSDAPVPNPIASGSSSDVLLPFGTADKPQTTITQPDTSSPTVFTQNVESPVSPKPKKFVKVFLALVSLIVILLIVCAGIVSYAIAYEKIDLPKYPRVKALVTEAVMSIPFMPKTPKYLIAKTLIAHEKITKHDYNISISLDSPSFASIANLSTIDIETKGAVDYEDPKNIRFTMDTSITKDFNFELIKPDKILYFKINKVPSFLFAMLGIQSQQLEPVMSKWISYDTTPLETEASKELKKDTEIKNLSEEVIDDFEGKYLTDTIVKKLKIEDVSEDGVNFYKLSLSFDKETLDEIEKALQNENGSTLYPTDTAKLSDVIKSMNWAMFINKKTYLTHKITVTSEMEVDQVSPTYGSAFLGTSNSITENSKVNFALVLKFDQFGEEVKVDVPSDVMNFEEFTNHISEIALNVYGSLMGPSMSQANDSIRKSDLQRLKIVLELYKTECGKYPPTLSELVTPPATCPSGKNLLPEIPKDPTQREYYYKPKNGDGYDLCTNLDIPETSTSDCPDNSFNYHVSFP